MDKMYMEIRGGGFVGGFFFFPAGLQLYQEGHYQPPEPTVTLCFGEEFLDFSTVKSKLIIVQVM